MKKGVLLFLLLIIPIVLIGCSDDDNGTNPVPEDRDRPPIPEPTYYSGPVPTKSVEMVVETVPLGDYMPRIHCAASPQPPEGYGYFPDSLYCSSDTDEHAVYPGRLLLMADDTIITTPMVGFLIGGLGNPWDFNTPAFPLEGQPYLQLVRYWARVGEVDRYAAGTTTTITRTTTRGTTETSASEFTKTLGIEASVSGSWFVDFEVKIKTEFSWSESHETSIMQEESYQESFQVAAPDDKNIVYCVWQLVEEYRIVGVEGGEFTDPHYDFFPDYQTAACPTNELVPITTYFDNH